MLSFLRPALRYTITAGAMWLAACGSSSNGDTDSPIEPPPPVIPALTEYTIDTDLISESSGLARSQRRDDLLWTLKDSGGATSLYGITTEGRHVVTLDVQGALANLDWEDLASYTHDGVAYLLIGDIGDNSAFRPVTTFYRIVEPEVTISDAVQSLSVTVDRIYTQAYPDGPRDAESLAVDGRDHMAYVLSKRDAQPMLYRFPLDSLLPLPIALPGIMEALGPIEIPRAPADFSGNVDAFNWTTAMDFDDAGTMAYVGTPLNGYWYQRQPDEDWISAMQRAPRAFALPPYSQIEAGTFARTDAATLYITSENLPAPLARLRP